MAFVKRTTKPAKGNRYYIRKASGGWSPCIQGSPKDPDCDVLSNCVGYAIGRFNEIGGWGSCKYLVSVNAENFIQYTDLPVGQTPKLGACMVWQKGATLSGADGAGHVAIVEQVVSDTEVLTSESAWGGKAFYTSTRKKGSDGKWGMGGDYKFLGFIYNPASCCQGGYTLGKTTDCVNVRTAPGTDKPIIRAIAKGTEVYLTGNTVTAGGMLWAQVRYGGQLAWIAKQYIKC